MSFQDVLELLRSWLLRPVVVVLEPDHSVMPGVLHEIDSAGIDGALFAVADPARRDARPTGIAIALFRDAFGGAERDDQALRVRQGRVEIIVSRPPGGTEARAPAR
jgi:hypothetical protein